MILKYKCEICLEETSKEVTFKQFWHHKTGMFMFHSCDLCTKALLKIGLARFSECDLELEEQKKRWLKLREEVLKNE